jgi:hypothetical protein
LNPLAETTCVPLTEVRRYFPGHGWFNGVVRGVIEKGQRGRHKVVASSLNTTHSTPY